MYTHLEDYIYNLYKSLGILKPEDLDMYVIAKKLELEIVYEENKIFYFGNEINLERGTKMEEWLDFAHEVCHHLRHAGLQISMHPLFIDLQENPAKYFVYHFCVPTFMLDELKGVNAYVIMEQFNVDEEFAFRRLEMYQNRRMLVARTYR